MKRILIALLVMLYALTGRGEVGSTKLSVEIKNTSAVLGEPVIIEVKMESTGVFKLAREFGPCDGGLLRIAVKNASGINTLIATDLPPCPSVLPPPSDVPVVYPSYQGQAKFTYKYWLMPGDYEVQASYHSENNTQNETAPFWTGILSSNVVMCHVDYPKGDDLQALLALGIDPSKEASPKIYVSVIRDHSIELLKKFPTATYAGYELAKCAKENLHDYINMSYEDIDEVLGVRGLIPEKQDAYRKERKKHFQDKLNLLQAFIAVHPDFVKADMIRSGISFYLLILGRQSEAMEEIKILSKMDGRWAEGAKKALSLTCQEDEKVKTKTAETSK